MYSSVAFSILELFCSLHHHLSAEIFHFPQLNLGIKHLTSHTLPQQALQLPFYVSMN